MNSPDTWIQQPKKVEQKQPEEPFLFGKSSKPKMEEHGPSFSAPEDSLQDASVQANTCGKVSLGGCAIMWSIKCQLHIYVIVLFAFVFLNPCA